MIGKKDEPMFQFDIDLGMRVDVEKKVAPEPKCFWFVFELREERRRVL